MRSSPGSLPVMVQVLPLLLRLTILVSSISSPVSPTNFHLTSSVPGVGVTVTEAVPLGSIVKGPLLLMVTVASGTSAGETVTVQVAVSPSHAAVIVAVPSPTASTLPSLSTVATLEALLVHVTALFGSGLPSSIYVAVRVLLSPTSSDRVVLFSVNVTVGGVGVLSLTVIVCSSLLLVIPLHTASTLIVAVPAFLI